MTSGVYYDRIWGNDSLNMFIFKDDPLRIQATWRPTDAGAPVYPNVFATPARGDPTRDRRRDDHARRGQVPTTAQVVATFEHMLTADARVYRERRVHAFVAQAVHHRYEPGLESGR